MSTPRVEIDLEKITNNARSLVRRLRGRGLSVTGVTKAVCGHPDIAKAMLKGGIADLADSRISNVMRMRAAGIACPISMIRAPVSQEMADIILCCDTSYHTEIDTIRKIGSVAREEGTDHQVILVVEMGDMRDGIMPEEVKEFASGVISTPGLTLRGIAANFACLGNVATTADDVVMLSRLADQVESGLGIHMNLVSGGGSANLDWAFAEGATGRINNLRLGEAILLGTNPVTGQPIDGLQTDAFAIFAEVIETKLKPSSTLPWPSARDYVKLRLSSKNIENLRSVLAIGRQDTDPGGLLLPAGFGFIGATGDHTILDPGAAAIAVGSEIKMGMNYPALMRAMSAPDLAKVVHQRPPINGSVTDTRPQPVLRLV